MSFLVAWPDSIPETAPQITHSFPLTYTSKVAGMDAKEPKRDQTAYLGTVA